MKHSIKNISIALLVNLFLLPNMLWAYTGEIIKSFNTPGAFSTGMTYDGKNIWLADRKEKKIFCIDKETGKVIRSIETPGYWPTGLAWDGEALWNADIKGGLPLIENYDGKIYKIDPKDGTILKTISAPSGAPRGLAFDGKYMWCVDNSKDELIQFDQNDGTTIKSFKAPSGDSEGLTFDGKYLWVSDRVKNEIYMVDPTSGCVIILTDAPGPFTRGLCYDGSNLWAVDFENDKLYELKVNDGENFRKYNEHKAKLTYTYQTTNFGPGKIKTLDVHLAVPSDRVNQTIDGDIKYTPNYTNIVTDTWGQKTAHFQLKDLNAGTISNVEMSMNVTTYDVRYFVYPDKVVAMSEIPEDIKNTYLKDDDKYQIKHPTIAKAVKESIGDEKNPYWIARKMYNYLLAHMNYEMVGGWNTAPTVLERGTGSCSEYSFVYIAMCRAAGLPARYVGSTWKSDEAYTDDVFHRWVEVYLPNYGWLPVDPSQGDRDTPRDQADRFGSLFYRFFITTQSGGGSETLEWTYNSNGFYTSEPKTNVAIDFFTDWKPLK